MNRAVRRMSFCMSMIAFSCAATTATAVAQATAVVRRKVDLAITFVADRTNAEHNSDQWLLGEALNLAWVRHSRQGNGPHN
jgi:hypothetical protein